MKSTHSLAWGTLGIVAMLGAGCALFRASTRDMDPAQPHHMTARYDYTDLRQLTRQACEDILASALVAERDTPLLMRLGTIQNRTEQHVDTRALAERLRSLLAQHGNVQFVAETLREDVLKEQEYQARHGEKDSRVLAGQQANPRYLLSGSLVEIRMEEPRQVRLARREIRYYSLTLEITDLQSAKIAWTRSYEITRLASQPLIGW